MSTLAQAAYRHLREDILRGALPAGQPLRLEQLKARYGVSFSPLREAMNRLLAERLLVTAPARGFAVAPLSWDELHDTTETRILIETEALRRSIARGDAAWEDAMSAALHLLDRQHDRVAALGDRAGYDDVSLLEDRHAAFHLSLIAACGSPRLLALCDQFNTETLRYRLPALVAGPRGAARGAAGAPARDVAAEHATLRDAALARRTDDAVALLAAHYRRTARDHAPQPGTAAPG